MKVNIKETQIRNTMKYQQNKNLFIWCCKKKLMKIEGSKADVSQVEQLCPSFYTFSIPLPEEDKCVYIILSKKDKILDSSAIFRMNTKKESSVPSWKGKRIPFTCSTSRFLIQEQPTGLDKVLGYGYRIYVVPGTFGALIFTVQYNYAFVISIGV